MLKKNLGLLDRGLRALIGLALIAGYVLNPDMAYSWLYLVGAAIALVTAALSICPLYSILGLSTCAAKHG